MRARAKKTKSLFFDGVLPVGTVLYRFAKSPSVKLVCEKITHTRHTEDEGGAYTFYKTNKGTYFDNGFVGSLYFLSAADALRYIAKENNINVRITERTTQN